MSYTLEEVKANIEENVIGKIKPLHTIDKHVYGFVDSKHTVDSVTQKNILEKKHLLPWAVGLAIDFLEEDERFTQLKGPTRDDLIMTAKFIHRDRRDEAGRWGNQVHDNLEIWAKVWIESGVRPEPITELLKRRGIEDYHIFGGARSGEAVFDRYGFIPVASEILVGIDGEKKAEGAGTLDLMVLTKDGELWLVDWKTSNNVEDFYAMQTATYARYFTHMTGLKVSKVLILKLDKESDRFRSYVVSYPNRAAAAFRRLSRVYDWLEDGKKKLVEDRRRGKI